MAGFRIRYGTAFRARCAEQRTRGGGRPKGTGRVGRYDGSVLLGLPAGIAFFGYGSFFLLIGRSRDGLEGVINPRYGLSFLHGERVRVGQCRTHQPIAAEMLGTKGLPCLPLLLCAFRGISWPVAGCFLLPVCSSYCSAVATPIWKRAWFAWRTPVCRGGLATRTLVLPNIRGRYRIRHNISSRQV